MREIKFRAWGKDYTTDLFSMCKPFDFKKYVKITEYAQENLYPFTGDETVFMQFTGLKDKNGVEIYEGDIVQFLKAEDYFPCVVRFGEHELNYRYNSYDSVGFYLSVGDTEQIEHQGLKYNFSRSEVIGNIYENPELLK